MLRLTLNKQMYMEEPPTIFNGHLGQVIGAWMYTFLNIVSKYGYKILTRAHSSNIPVYD